MQALAIGCDLAMDFGDLLLRSSVSGRSMPWPGTRLDTPIRMVVVRIVRPSLAVQLSLQPDIFHPGLQSVLMHFVVFVPFSQQGAQMLYSFISQRYLHGSVMITTNLAFTDWTEVFQGARLVGALLDRLNHHCHVIEFSGDSYRFRQSLSQQSSPAAAPLSS
jgi:hypothetical protein